jgi:hypothetical protein
VELAHLAGLAKLGSYTVVQAGSVGCAVLQLWLSKDFASMHCVQYCEVWCCKGKVEGPFDEG